MFLLPQDCNLKILKYIIGFELNSIDFELNPTSSGMYTYYNK